jgi:hypothetical protein
MDLTKAVTVGRILFMYGIREFNHPEQLHVEFENSSSKKGSLSNGPHNKKLGFSAKGL